MKITGHKTENTYKRYAIVSDQDMREAAARLSPKAADEIPDEVWRILTDESPAEGADVRNLAYSSAVGAEGAS